MKDYFYVNGQGETGHIASGRVLEDGRTVSLLLVWPVWQANQVTYLPSCCYAGGGVYEGPWIRNPRGIGALSFWGVPIMENSGVEENQPHEALRLLGNTPNPFDRETAIRLSIPNPQGVRIMIFDAEGRLIRSLFDGSLPAGERSVRWDGTDRLGQRAASGTYWYRIQSQSGAQDGRMILVR